MKNFDPENCLIFECITGSRLYGTNTPESDFDYRGICVPPMNILLDPFMNFDQKDSGFEEEDRAIYALGKFMKLCADANPNIIELLFIPLENIVVTSDIWKKIILNRHLFLSKKAKYTFTGYAYSQLNAIKNHRQWFVNPPKVKPTRKMFNLTDSPIITGENLQFAMNIPHSMFKDEYHDELVRERNYRDEKKKWDNYVAWRDNRNPARKELEDKYGYDCYVEQTEFLTNCGWKKYSEITKDELLATINPLNNSIKFLPYINRFCYYVDDEVFDIKTQVTHCKVTKNHKLYLSDIHRSKKNNFSRLYEAKLSNWRLETVENIKEKRRLYYHTMNYPNNVNLDWCVSDDYLKLLGLYVSEGSLIKYKDGYKGISISQMKENNKIKEIVESIGEYKINVFEFERNGKIEITYIIYGKDIANRILEDGGRYSVSKKLPQWIYQLSTRQANILLDALMSGDGTSKKYSRIYYTSSQTLANMVQILAILSENYSKVWSYSWADRTSLHQVHVSKFYGQYGNLNRNKITLEKYKGNVVCFEVSNSILVTRLNGEIAFHGNCKHASHLVRLMTEGKELLLTGNITFPLTNAEEITAIKRGKYTYDEILELAETMEKEFETWYNESPLPNSPNKKELTKLYLDIIEEYNK